MKSAISYRVAWLLGLSLVLGLCCGLEAATVSGTVVIPAAPNGWAPSLSNMSVRVEGTTLSGTVDGNTGAFSIADVPAGAVTLLLVEESGKDTFTQASKRSYISVTGDVTDASFNLQYHWQLLPSYPSVWGTAGYETWETYWVTEQIGYIIFKINGPPIRVEVYGTGDGGMSWAEVGNWIKDDAAYNAGTQTFPLLDPKMFWSDANHGVVVAARQGNGIGFFYTANGGASWSVVNVPLVSTAYNANIDRFAKISDSHWIVAGWIGANVQGYGSGFYNAIWETTDSGATWTVTDSYEGNEGCTALGANSDGDAICFRTPYWGGARKVSARSGTTGAWTTTASDDMVVNSGYGPADVPMFGDTAWAYTGGSRPAGLYRSTQAGVAGSWTKISEMAPQYMSFGSALKGFATGGGPTYITYDGGVSWLYQSGGGGLCCHGNDIFAFDSVHAVWRDRGVGDPDNGSTICTYSEPWTANFEVLPGVSIPNSYIQGGETNVPMASLKIVSHGPVPIQINSMTVTASGTGDDAANVAAVKLWLDADNDGMVRAGDTLLGQGTYSADNGTVLLSTGGALQMTQLIPVYVLVTHDMGTGFETGKTFSCSVPSASIVAEKTDTHGPVIASAPENYATAGRTITAALLVFSDDFESGLGKWTATTQDPVPDAGYGWTLGTNHHASGAASAYIHEDRGHDGCWTQHDLTLATPIDLSAAGTYYLAFNEYYAMDPTPMLIVYASSNGGSTWEQVRLVGSWDWVSTGAGYQEKVYDLTGMASGASVLVRFEMDWTGGAYYNATWSVDDVRVYRVPSASPPDDGGTGDDGGSDPGTNPPSDSGGTDTGGNPDQSGGNTDTSGDDGNPDTGSEQVGGETPDGPLPIAPLCGFGLTEMLFASAMLWFAGRRRR